MEPAGFEALTRWACPAQIDSLHNIRGMFGQCVGLVNRRLVFVERYCYASPAMARPVIQPLPGGRSRIDSSGRGHQLSWF